MSFSNFFLEYRDQFDKETNMRAASVNSVSSLFVERYFEQLLSSTTIVRNNVELTLILYRKIATVFFKEI